jgi:serine/threonine-protein kinase
LRRHLPEGSFAVAPREFPLDGSCNPVLPARGPESVRCVAARARVCLEGHPRASEFAGALYRHQKGLSPERVLELAAPYKGRAEMEACMASPATRGRLEEDAILGSRFDADGTPIVAVNGKKGTSFGPFLYAIVLARGDAGHPAFRGLPAPNPQAHIH